MVDVEKFEEGRRLHPLTLLHGSLISIPALLILMLPLLRGGNLYSSLLYLFFFLVISVPLWLVRYLRFRYWITPKEIVIRSGVFTTQHRNIPIERVQNIEIERGVAARLMGLAKVKIQTAGSSSTEGVLEYVSQNEAQAIRDVVRVFKRRVAEPGSATMADTVTPSIESDLETPTPDEVLVSMSIRRVLMAGVFRFSLIYVALFFSAIQYLGIDVDEIVDWVILGRSETATLLADASPFVIAIVTMVIVALMAWITGIALTLNRFFRFELKRDLDEKLHLRYGLLTLAERTLPLRRIQALVIRTNPLMRWFGWYRLEIQMMGLDAESRGRHVVVPFARWSEIAEILPQIRPLRLPDDFTSVSGKTVRRYTIRASLFIGLTVAAIYFIWSDALWLLALLPFGYYFAHCHYRNHGYALDPEAFFVRRGVFREHLWILPVDRFQAFFLQSSFFQRRLGLRSLYVDTAGAAGSGQSLLSDIPAEVAEDLADLLIDRFQGREPQPFGAPPFITEGASTGLHPPEARHP
jgi:putative membrane protein